jgi:hypothetical protein
MGGGIAMGLAGLLGLPPSSFHLVELEKARRCHPFEVGLLDRVWLSVQGEVEAARYWHRTHNDGAVRLRPCTSQRGDGDETTDTGLAVSNRGACWSSGRIAVAGCTYIEGV